MITGHMTNHNFPLFQHLSGILPMGPLSVAHGHNSLEVTYIASGNITLLIEDRTYTLTAGNLYIVNSARYHYLDSPLEGLYERYILHLEPASFPRQTAGFSELAEVFRLPNNSMAAGMFPRLDYYHNTLSEEEFADLLPHLVEELIVNLKLCADYSIQSTEAVPPILTKALEYINNHLFTISGIEEVSQALFISPNYLFYLFRSAMHSSPKRYITEKRLLAAQQMIRSGHKPSSVYALCGFRYYSTFHHGYCSFFGHPPSQDQIAKQS